MAAVRKTDKYRDLPTSYHFIPVAIETFGPVNEAACNFLSEIGRRISQVTEDSRESSYLRQRISIALQRFNAVCFRGSFTAYEHDETGEGMNPDLDLNL